MGPAHGQRARKLRLLRSARCLVKKSIRPLAARTMVEKLQLNSELKARVCTPLSDKLLSMTLLDTLAAHLPDAVCLYKTGKIHQSKWRDAFDQVCFEVSAMLEENDRMEGNK
eukprot:6186792-Pleurochrysis_carterae.AAC.2